MVYGRNDLKWDGNTLRLGKRALASIEPDKDWLGMYRVRINGLLTDMVNLTRAKDAAISLALADLNNQERPAEGPPDASKRAGGS